MNKEIAERWQKALVSGEYAQGVGHLRRDNKFCCLGVLCELAVQDGVIERTESRVNRFKYGDENVVLPGPVIKWANMGSIDGTWGPKITDNVVQANDGDQKDFGEIAKLIHKHWKEM